MERYIEKDGKKMRYGYTTGSCAAAASKACVMALFNNIVNKHMIIDTPKGWILDIEVTQIETVDDSISYSVIKDSGDDPDVTNGIDICASVKISKNPGVHISGGLGVGRVTKRGLRIPVGEAAINPVPLQMIKSEVLKVLPQGSGVDIIIFVPQGIEIAKKTFNAKLGIIGGISILGTSGIVEPMSEDSWKESLKLEMGVKVSMNRDKMIYAFGNFGVDYLIPHNINENNIQKTSNFVKYMMKAAVDLNIKKILFVGHAGKMVKVANGMENTHSKYGDGRMESIVSCADDCDLTSDERLKLLSCNTSDEAAEVLKEMGHADIVFKEVANRCKRVCETMADHKLVVECIVFSTIYGELSKTSDADKMLEEIKS